MQTDGNRALGAEKDRSEGREREKGAGPQEHREREPE